MLTKDAGRNQIKDVDLEQGVVTGYFSVFGEKDSDGDIIQQGAFAKTIAEKGRQGSNRIKHLYQHDPDKVLSKPELAEDERGLYFKSEIVRTTLGNDVLKLYDQGVLDEHSIGFIPIKVKFDDEAEATIITEIDLWEGSTVTWGAQEMARVDQRSKSYVSDKVNKIRKELKHGSYTDQTFEELEKWIDKLLNMGTQHEPEPGDPTQGNDEPPEVKQLQSLNEMLNF